MGVGRGWAAIGAIDDLIATWEPDAYDPARVWAWANRHPEIALRVARYARLEAAWTRACGDLPPPDGTLPEGASTLLRHLAAGKVAPAIAYAEALNVVHQGQQWEDRNPVVFTRAGLIAPLALLGGRAGEVAGLAAPDVATVRGWFGDVDAALERVWPDTKRRRGVLLDRFDAEIRWATRLLGDGHLFVSLPTLAAMAVAAQRRALGRADRLRAWTVVFDRSPPGRLIRWLTTMPEPSPAGEPGGATRPPAAGGAP